MKAPAPLDIVWCRFPEREHPERPGPKERPVLVLAVSSDGMLVATAYGTSQAHGQLRAWNIENEDIGAYKTGKIRSYDQGVTLDANGDPTNYFLVTNPLYLRLPCERH